MTLLHQDRPGVFSPLRLPAPLLFFGILLLAFYFRVIGFDWDEGQLLHPDERFMNMVFGSVEWPKSWSQFINTAASPINPYNKNFSFYVYGTVPIFLNRFLIEFIFPSGFPTHIIGRLVSMVADLGTLILTFLIARRLFSRSVAYLGMFFFACCVVAIQQAHFGVVDALGTTLATLALYFAVVIATSEAPGFLALLVPSVLFGIATGLAAATKIPNVLIAPVLFLALLTRTRSIKKLAGCLLIGALFTMLTIRIGQPYAFAGPGFFNFAPNQHWLDNMKELKANSNPTIYFPPGVQWIDRSKSYAFLNMFHWGVGELPTLVIGLAVIFSLFRIVRARAWTAGLLLVWALVSFMFNGVITTTPTLRYQLPSYPPLFILAAWFLIEMKNGGMKPRWVASALTVCTVIYIGLWAFAFSRIYSRPQPRIAASHWILKNIPGPLNLNGYLNNQPAQFPLQIPTLPSLTPNGSALLSFYSDRGIAAGSLFLSKVTDLLGNNVDAGSVRISVRDPALSNRELGVADASIKNSAVTAQFDPPLQIDERRQYLVRIDLTDVAVPLSIRRQLITHETDWDDGLPLRVDGYDPYGGIYEGGPRLNIYWEEKEPKLCSMTEALAKADYLFMTSNRQWGSVGRLPDIFPKTAKLYQILGACPDERQIPKCYSELVPGADTSALGYKLIKEFHSYPNIGSVEWNDELADEAFSVYDHPKVLIFKNEHPKTQAEILKILGVQISCPASPT